MSRSPVRSSSAILMNKKRLSRIWRERYRILSLSLVASLILSACGAGASASGLSAPEPTQSAPQAPTWKGRPEYAPGVLVDYTAQTVDHYRLVRSDGKPSGIETDTIDATGEEPLLRQLRDFVDCCRSRGRPLADAEAARRALATALRILAAIEARLT